MGDRGSRGRLKSQPGHVICQAGKQAGTGEARSGARKGGESQGTASGMWNQKAKGATPPQGCPENLLWGCPPAP